MFSALLSPFAGNQTNVPLAAMFHFFPTAVRLDFMSMNRPSSSRRNFVFKWRSPRGGSAMAQSFVCPQDG